MTYLIFGSKGYVASNLIEHLKEKQKNFINLSISGNYSNNYLNTTLNDIFNEFMKNGEKSCDLLINKFVEKFYEKLNNNLVQIAFIPTGYCHKFRSNKLNLVKYNFQLPYFYALISCKLKVKKLIYISSAGIFSKAIQPIENNYFINPQNEYLLTKYLTELKIENFVKKNNDIQTKIIILRPTIIYGSITKGSFMMLEKLVKLGIPILIKKNKSEKSLLHINNLIKFVEKIYDCEENDIGGINKFLLTDDQIVTLEQIITWIAYKNNKKVKVIKLNNFLIKCLKIIYPIYKLFKKLNANLVYKKSELNPNLHLSMTSKILEDLNKI